MANGKGSLDCNYCIHLERYPEGSSEEGLCKFHEVILPPPNTKYDNRICCHFEPNASFHRDNPFPQFMPLARQFAWFGIDMEPGVLYEFQYNQPPGITKTSVLRVADYASGTWKKPNG